MAFKSLSIIILILTLYPNALTSQWLPHRPQPRSLPQPENPRPLCASQLALVNRACALLPFTSILPPKPPSDDDEPEPEEPEEGRHHSHRHPHRSRRQGYVETEEEEECCRWLKEVDNVCVCDLLVHLPLFLTRPIHEYKVVVDDDCEVSFECGSRLVKY